MSGSCHSLLKLQPHIQRGLGLVLKAVPHFAQPNNVGIKQSGQTVGFLIAKSKRSVRLHLGHIAHFGLSSLEYVGYSFNCNNITPFFNPQAKGKGDLA